jgi:uncharacterized protein (DUF58 family)
MAGRKRPLPWSGWYERWLSRRLPAARMVVLDQRRVFIFPDRPGLYFLVVMTVMLVAAINYQNNMAFALTFFLFSLFIVAILHTFSNLSGLRLEALRGHSAFAGDTVEFEIQLQRPASRRYYAITLGWPGQPMASTSIADSETVTLKLFHHAAQRGWLRPGRLSVKTVYPLGLLRAWTWIDLDFSALIYPRPLPGPRPSGDAGDEQRAQQRSTTKWQKGSEDFYGFRLYRSGDNLRHVLWRAYAKGQRLQSKQFAELPVSSHWLRWDDVSGEREQRLSLLCYWVLELHRNGEVFGLQLPGETLAPNAGEQHRDAALRMLALFGRGSPGDRGRRS